MAIDHYFSRFGFCGRQIATAPRKDLNIVVVIPSFNEPDLVGSLESLWMCDRPQNSVEVIVVINSPANCSVAVKQQNQKTLKEASAWIESHFDDRLTVRLLHFPELPPKQAGVGLARKIGMDEAARRFDDIGKSQLGIIVGYDADCRCARNYLTALDRHFQENPRSPGCSICFEHPLTGPLEPRIYDAIAAYELHLRYYVQALHFTGSPFGFHTIGSCMAVRPGVYLEQGGMNKRPAGEDFYFLQKIIALGGFTNLAATTVYPSPRVSDRVPFGTGRAVSDFLKTGEFSTDPFQAFLDLKTLFVRLPDIFRTKNFASTDWTNGLPESVQTFFAARNLAPILEEIRWNTASEAAFQKRFFRCFDGFEVMKFVHHARDHFYGAPAIQEEAEKLWRRLSGAKPSRPRDSIRELLADFRQLERLS